MAASLGLVVCVESHSYDGGSRNYSSRTWSVLFSFYSMRVYVYLTHCFPITSEETCETDILIFLKKREFNFFGGLQEHTISEIGCTRCTLRCTHPRKSWSRPYRTRRANYIRYLITNIIPRRQPGRSRGGDTCRRRRSHRTLQSADALGNPMDVFC